MSGQPHTIRLARPWRRVGPGPDDDDPKSDAPRDQPVSPGLGLIRRFHRPTLDRDERVRVDLANPPPGTVATLNDDPMNDGDDITERLERFNELRLGYTAPADRGAEGDIRLIITPDTP